MNKAKRTEIFTRLRDANPNPTTELEYSSAFELLVAVTLSAQATDVGVNKATAKLFPVANTPEAIYALGEDGLKEYIKTIGLFNSKAANVIKACKILIDKHDSVVQWNTEILDLPHCISFAYMMVFHTHFIFMFPNHYIKILFLFFEVRSCQDTLVFGEEVAIVVMLF